MLTQLNPLIWSLKKNIEYIFKNLNIFFFFIFKNLNIFFDDVLGFKMYFSSILLD